MSKVIWKIALDPRCKNAMCKIEMPEGSEILSVGVVYAEICMWALVDPKAPRVTRAFVGYQEDQDILEHLSLNFIGTVMRYNGAEVTHLFEVV